MEKPNRHKRGYTMLRTRNVVLDALRRSPDAQRRIRILDRENFNAHHQGRRRKLPGRLAVNQAVPVVPLPVEPETQPALDILSKVDVRPVVPRLPLFAQIHEIMPPPTQMSLE